MKLKDAVCVLITHKPAGDYLARCGHCLVERKHKDLAGAIRWARRHVSQCKSPGLQQFLHLRGQRYDNWFIGFG